MKEGENLDSEDSSTIVEEKSTTKENPQEENENPSDSENAPPITEETDSVNTSQTDSTNPSTVDGTSTANDENSQVALNAKADEIKPVFYIALFVLGMSCLGVFDLTFKLGPNQCKMTYMYEWPEYINISMGKEVESAFPMYGLYVYGEGMLTEQLREMEFSGIPVLYIPGNGGSYKQVRSLASVALRKAIEDSDYEIHFDYFSIDFNEEQSAIYGGVLLQQADFARKAVDKILSLYPQDKNHPKSVVLVGHSMGGLIAKSLFLDPTFKAQNVQVMINLATPSIPVLTVDWATRDFYEAVNEHWEAFRPEHINLISIGGGARDLQVRGGLTSDKHADTVQSSTDTSSVWVSADHRCIVWCKQLVLAVNRALADMVEKSSKQISSDRDFRERVLNYHLVHRSGGKKYKKGKLHTKPVKFNSSSTDWKLVTGNRGVITKENPQNVENFVIPITGNTVNSIIIDAVEMDADNFLFGCTSVQQTADSDVSSTVCTEYTNLSARTKIMPSRGKRKMFSTNLRAMIREEGLEHLMISLPALEKEEEGERGPRVYYDMYSAKQRSVNVTVPNWVMFFKWHNIIETTQPSSIFYNISLNGMLFPYQAFDIHIEPKQCKKPITPDPPTQEHGDMKDLETDQEELMNHRHFGLARFVTPWANDTTQALIVADDANFTNMLSAKFLTTKLPEDSRVAQVHLFLDPDCSYSVSLRPSPVGLMGQILRYYTPMLPAYLTTTVILTISQQILRMGRADVTECKSVFFTILAAVSPISVVLPSKLMAYVTAQPAVAKFLPPTDYVYIQESGLDFGMLPILLMFLSISLTFLLYGALYGLLIGCGYSWNKALVTFTARRAPTEAIAEYAVSSVLTRFPVILGVLGVALALSTCGAFAMVILTIAYFIRIFLLYEDYLDGGIRYLLGVLPEKPSLSQVHYDAGLFMLFFASTTFSLPTLLTWISRFGYISTSEGGGASLLPMDPTLLPAIILSTCLPLLWLDESAALPVHHARLSRILQFFAILTLAYGQVSLYRVPYTVCASLASIAVHNAIAKFGPSVQLIQDEN